jgi:hypothetical protein
MTHEMDANRGRRKTDTANGAKKEKKRLMKPKPTWDRQMKAKIMMKKVTREIEEEAWGRRPKPRLIEPKIDLKLLKGEGTF